MTNGIKNKIVTSIYELNFIEERGSSVYKSFPLLSHTIRKIIFPNYWYVIYTDEKTLNTYNLSEMFNYPNVEIKIHELNSEFYTNILLPIKSKRISEGHIWDRIYSVNNYLEVILNKFEFLLKESNNYDGNVVWIDAGLFGTSCNDIWRDYINEIAHTNHFIKCIFNEINNNNFISLRGNSVHTDYISKEKIKKLFNVNCKIIAGGIFGGKSNLITTYFSNYKDVAIKMSDNDFITSEQEILSILLDPYSDIKYFDFDDWGDFQRSILTIIGLYDPSIYKIDVCKKS